MRSALAQTCVQALVLFACVCAPRAYAEEHITLINGFELVCNHREVLPETGLMRLYTGVGRATYLDVDVSTIRLIEPVEAAVSTSSAPVSQPTHASGTDIGRLLVDAGSSHHIDADLLHALVHAESAFQAKAVSRAGARGLMQLMPATAVSFGVKDSFRADQNIAGGTAYLDSLLHRFHDNIALALAAYNAGPAAVDRYHGIPPYRETRAYVARIISEYNSRKLAATQQAAAR